MALYGMLRRLGGSKIIPVPFFWANATEVHAINAASSQRDLKWDINCIDVKRLQVLPGGKRIRAER